MYISTCGASICLQSGKRAFLITTQKFMNLAFTQKLAEITDKYFLHADRPIAQYTISLGKLKTCYNRPQIYPDYFLKYAWNVDNIS